jgi:hypothetical protein
MPKNITSSNWSSSNLPSGLALNAATGVISGTPNVQPGVYTANVSVSTNYGSDSKPITVNVAVPDDWLPVITPNQVIYVTADESMSPYTVTGLNVR